MGDSLINHSNTLQTKSTDLLKNFNFVRIAESYFKKVELVGSAKMNLMLDADIDINCEVEEIDYETVLNFVGELLKKKECRKVILYDHTYEEEPFFIVNIEKFDYKDERWIVTFYISTDLAEAKTLVNWVNERLDNEKRKLILMLKEYRENNNQKRSIPSHLIYKAVLENGVNSIEEFKEYLKENSINPDVEDAY